MKIDLDDFVFGVQRFNGVDEPLSLMNHFPCGRHHLNRGSHMTFVATRMPMPIAIVSHEKAAAIAKRADELERSVVRR